MIIIGPTTFEKKNLKKLVPNNTTLKSAFMFSYLGPRNRNYALYNNGKLTGFALTTNEKPILYLDLIVTKVHGKGYGQMLMSRIKNNAKKNGFTRINLSTVNNKKTKNFYKLQGFTKTPNQPLNSSLSLLL
jgi:GNAT superfamily N-acetyltransferase